METKPKAKNFDLLEYCQYGVAAKNSATRESFFVQGSFCSPVISLSRKRHDVMEFACCSHAQKRVVWRWLNRKHWFEFLEKGGSRGEWECLEPMAYVGSPVPRDWERGCYLYSRYPTVKRLQNDGEKWSDPTIIIHSLQRYKEELQHPRNWCS